MRDRIWPGEFSFCPMCGSDLDRVVRGGARRQACEQCGYVHFRNPGVGAAVVLRDGSTVLLVRRGPGTTQEGRWSIPAGFVDYGEDVRLAAARELKEETGLVAEVGEVVHVASNFHDPAKLTVGVWFSGRRVGGELRAGDDADRVGWFDLHDLPPLAFPTDAELLRRLRSGG
ncbi:MAG: NUDIX hydrolase [Acidimicrobiia bacterium]|nr:NUDIX hydrolase [Acidimicrobiia bacterium]